MPLINFSGIASGIDSNALIEATSNAARAVRVLPHENKIEELETTNDALSQLKTLLTSLKGVVEDFATLNGGVIEKNAQSSDESILSASASSAAANGTYLVTVSKLARNATWSSFNENGDPDQKYTSGDNAINPNAPAGDHTVTVTIGSGGTPTVVNMTVTNTTTLAQFVSSFNQATTKATAIIVNAGTASSPDYRVVIQGNSTGLSDGQITVSVPPEISDPDGIVSSGDERWNSNELVQAQDAEFTVSGISGTIKRSTNSVADLIQGVTLNLKSEEPLEPVTVTISNDASATAAKLKEFVSKYNEVVAFINENDIITQEGSGEDTKNIFGPLSLSSVDNNITAAIRTAMSNSAYYNTGDPVTATNTVRMFTDLGIRTDSNAYNAETKTGGGTLLFDETKTGDLVAAFNDALSAEPASINKIINKFGDLAGLTGGVIAQFTQANGLIDSSVNSNKEQIEDLNDRIAQAERSILQQEQAMRSRFARLESLMGRLQSQQSALSSALASLPSNN